MEVLVFGVVAAVAVAAAITMVLQRNAMYSAIFLVLNFFCLSVLYVLLGAYFVAVVQVAVYAGAIMVLMLFVIMLLNVAQPEPRDTRLGFLRPFGVLAAVVLAIELAVVIARGAGPPAPAAPGAAGAAGGQPAAQTTPVVRPTPTVAPTVVPSVPGSGAATIGHTQLLAADLFTKFLFPFEVTSILLLAAILGASVLARKRPEHT
jgi:NADH-quinone oxidoreductase subunit J